MALPLFNIENSIVTSLSDSFVKDPIDKSLSHKVFPYVIRIVTIFSSKTCYEPIGGLINPFWDFSIAYSDKKEVRKKHIDPVHELGGPLSNINIWHPVRKSK